MKRQIKGALILSILLAGCLAMGAGVVGCTAEQMQKSADRIEKAADEIRDATTQPIVDAAADFIPGGNTTLVIVGAIAALIGQHLRNRKKMRDQQGQ